MRLSVFCLTTPSGHAWLDHLQRFHGWLFIDQTIPSWLLICAKVAGSSEVDSRSGGRDWEWCHCWTAFWICAQNLEKWQGKGSKLRNMDIMDKNPWKLVSHNGVGQGGFCIELGFASLQQEPKSFAAIQSCYGFTWFWSLCPDSWECVTISSAGASHIENLFVSLFVSVCVEGLDATGEKDSPFTDGGLWHNPVGSWV